MYQLGPRSMMRLKGVHPDLVKVFKVTLIKDGQYLIGNDNRHRVWHRHDLLLVPGVEGKDGNANE